MSGETTKRNINTPDQERRFDQSQYEFLLWCSSEGEEGITQWNEWRRGYSGTPILLEGAQLQGAYLQDIDFRDVLLDTADLSGADAGFARFYRARLGQTDFSGANLQGAVFSSQYLKTSDLTSVCNGKPRAQRFSPRQYAVLLACSRAGDMTEWNNWRAKHPAMPVLLEGAQLADLNFKGVMLDTGEFTDFTAPVFMQDANLNDTHLEEARLHRAHMERANLWGAYVRRADFFHTHLEQANLEDSYWEGTYLEFAHLQGTRCRAAVVDGFTLLWECTVDRKTDFSEVALTNMRVNPGSRQLLEYNIRRKNWIKWYHVHPVRRFLVQPFWWLSDYGLSTGRIVGTFFALALVFAVLYYVAAVAMPPGVVNSLLEGKEGAVPGWLVPIRAVYFSVVTMTTLGFGDMHANCQSLWGHILLTLQVLFGYVLLGALVTRFAVLFTAGGPAGRFAESAPEAKEKAGTD